MAFVPVQLIESVRRATSTDAVFKIVSDVVLGDEYDGAYFFGGLYDEPAIQKYLGSSEDPKAAALFGLLQILVYGVVADLDAIVGNAPPLLKGPIEKELKSLVSESYRHRLQVLSILSLVGNPTRSLSRVSHQLIASAVGIEGAVDVAVCRKVEALVMDVIASELALCRIDQHNQVVDVRNVVSRHVFPGSAKEATTQLIYVPVSASSNTVPTVDALLAKLESFDNNIRDATSEGDVAFTEELRRGPELIAKDNQFQARRKESLLHISKRYAEEKRKLETGGGREGLGRMMDVGASEFKNMFGGRR
jgi:hypothetical protein